MSYIVLTLSAHYDTFMCMPKLSNFTFSEEKSRALRKERGLGFEEIILYIEAGHVVDIIKNPNHEVYSQQNVYIVDIEGYTWMVPHHRKDKKVHLITAFPSRKAKKTYARKDKLL